MFNWVLLPFSVGCQFGFSLFYPRFLLLNCLLLAFRRRRYWYHYLWFWCSIGSSCPAWLLLFDQFSSAVLADTCFLKDEFGAIGASNSSLIAG